MSETILASRIIGGCRHEIDTDHGRLDLGLIHDFLSRCSHWARNMPFPTLQRSIAHSICFGLYCDAGQIGFARVVSDQATFAYLADVFVVETERGVGLGQWLIETILADPRLQGLRLWMLVTRDAESLYRRCGFAGLSEGRIYMQRFDPEIYAAAAEGAAPG